MSNIAYMVRYGNENEESIGLIRKCVESLRKASDCSIYMFVCQGNNEILQKELSSFKINFFISKNEEWFNKRQACKIENLKRMNLSNGDRIMVLDCDLFFKRNPFEIFNSDSFDVFYTSRNYSYFYTVNAGVWGFKYNDKTKKFLDFYIDEIYNPSWGPYLKFRERFHRVNGQVDWWVDQDLLCVIHDNLDRFASKFPDISLYDAGYRYNFCPSYDILKEQAIEEMRKAKTDPSIIICHFKGEIKNVIKEF